MKLASLTHGRDGRLVVVSKDLTRATDAFPVVPTLQAALDDWDRYAPRLTDLAETLEHGSVPSFRFHEHDCAAPLPRAYQWLDASAYVNHVELVRKARGAEMPESFWTDPLMYQGGSDSNLAPRQAVRARSEVDGIDFEAEIAVVTGDVPMGVSPEAGPQSYPPDHARKRRQPAESGCERIGERLWIRSVKAADRFFPGRRDAGRTGRRAGPAASCICRCWRSSTASPSAGPMPAST
jgi:hypothetical protein